MPSEKAKPLPAELARKSRTTAEHPSDDKPKIDQAFGDPQSNLKWAEFNTCHVIRNPVQVKVDFVKPKTLWFYLGKTSTEAKAQYTGDLKKQLNDPSANFLDTVRATYAPVSIIPPRRSLPAAYPAGANIHALNAAGAGAQYRQQVQPRPQPQTQVRYQTPKERPYHGKYAITDPIPPYKRPGYNVDTQALYNQRAFTQKATTQNTPSSLNTQGSYRAPQAQMSPTAPTAPMTAGSSQRPLQDNYSTPSNLVRGIISIFHDLNSNLSLQWSSSSFQPPKQSLQQPSQPQRAKQPQPNQYTKPQPQAPVANMMGGASFPSQKTPSRPSSTKPAQKPNNIRKVFVVPIKSVERPSDPFLEKYPYLREASKLRPATYQSPYDSGGCFTSAYLPNPQAPTNIPQISISEEFLMARSSTEQQKVRNYRLQIRDSSAQRQREEILRQQAKLQNQQRQRQFSQARPVQSYVKTNQSPSVNYQPQHHRPSQQYSAPLHSHNSYAYDLSPPPYLHAQSYLHNSSPLHQSYPTSGLQYQSPQDFQMQMQRESQRNGNGGSFDHFFKGLQNAAAAGHERAGSYGGGSGGQGSPLKTEMGNGGEMLPMMRDVRY